MPHTPKLTLRDAKGKVHFRRCPLPRKKTFQKCWKFEEKFGGIWRGACWTSFVSGMEAPTKHDPFIDTTFVDSGNESSDSSGSSESSSSGHSSTGSPESDFSANSSDSEASGAPLRDTTKKLFKELYNNCKESNVVGVKAILPGA